MNEILYPRSPRGPMREISERLELGMLSASSAKELCAKGLDWQLVAAHVHDLEWWRDQPLNICAPPKQHWDINAWDATLRLATSDIILWIDPGHNAPIPNIPPNLVVITHAHADHTDQLQEWVTRFPEIRIVMTPRTAQLLSLRDGGHGDFLKILERTIQVDFDEIRIIEGITLRFLTAGHLLGAAMLEIGFGPDRILITGDFALREVGGLPGAKIPTGDYAYVIMEAKECFKKTLPFADLQSTRTPFLSEVMEKTDSDQRIVQIKAQSLGQAQEAYVSLIMSQRAGAFKRYSVCLDGLASSASGIYAEQLGRQSGPWNIPFLKAADGNSTHRLIITPEGYKIANSDAVVEPLTLYTHAGWAEKMAFATYVSCHQVHFYHGFSNSLDIGLNEIGRKTGTLTKEVAI